MSKVIIFALIFISSYLIYILERSQVSESKYIPKLVLENNSNILGFSEIMQKNEKLDFTMHKLEEAFSGKYNFRDTSKVVSLVFSGDVMLGRSVNRISNSINNYKWAFEKTYDFLRNGDITVINLENPLIENCPETDEGFVFCGSTKHIEGLNISGIDLVSLANNHVENYGKDGLDQTIELLNANNIQVIGTGQVSYIEKKGIKFAFLSFNDIGNVQNVENASDEKIRNSIIKSKQFSDFVIVIFHFGQEYTNTPNNRQKYIAQKSIDFGADLVLGNHPHVVQTAEIYNGKLIVYSHGNFIFDQMWSTESRSGIIGEYFFSKEGLIASKFIPIVIYDYGQARIEQGSIVGNEILDNMKNRSMSTN